MVEGSPSGQISATLQLATHCILVTVAQLATLHHLRLKLPDSVGLWALLARQVFY